MTPQHDLPQRHEDRTLTASIKLYYDLDVTGDVPQPLLVAVHGYGASKRQMMRQARLMAPKGFAIASLQGFHQHIKEPKEKDGPLRFGFGWVTNFHPDESVAIHHRAVLDLVESLVQENIADSRNVFLLGFSQSCALNFRFAFTHTEVLAGIIGICGGLPGDWDTSEQYKQTNAHVLYMHGDEDEFYPPSRVEDYETRLRQRAKDVKVRKYQAGHEIVPAMRDDVREWLKSHVRV
jgi:phospholipase/carboxylesterase